MVGTLIVILAAAFGVMMRASFPDPAPAPGIPAVRDTFFESLMALGGCDAVGSQLSARPPDGPRLPRHEGGNPSPDRLRRIVLASADDLFRIRLHAE